MLGREDIEQIKLFDWIKSKPELEPFCFHVANERKCSQLEGRLLKRKGVKKGVSDNFIMIPRGKYHGLIIELKIPPNKLTKEQEQFFKDMRSMDYCCIECHDKEEAQGFVNDYLALGIFSCSGPSLLHPI